MIYENQWKNCDYLKWTHNQSVNRNIDYDPVTNECLKIIAFKYNHGITLKNN